MPIEIKKVIGYRLWVLGVGCWVMGLIIFLIHNYCFAVQPPQYEINAYIDTVNHKISAKQKVTFTNNTDKELGEIYFHIYPNRKYSEAEKRLLLRYAAYFNINPYPAGFQSGGLKINSAGLNNQKLNYKIEGEDETILKVTLPDKLSAGSSVAIDLDFSVDIPHSYGRFGWHKNIISLLRWYPILSVLDAQGWHNYPFYPYHQPYFSEAAGYSVYLTLPGEQVVIHSGELKDEFVNPDGTKTVFIQSELPLRDFGLAISPDYKAVSEELNGVRINSYYTGEDSFSARKALENAADLLAYYSKKFTPYPYKEFSIAPVFLGYGGTQSSNLIFIDTRAYQLPGFLSRYFDFLIAHEAGHQWFYNLVGSDEYKEMFIDEGLNSYFVLNYLNDKYGPQAEVMVIPRGLRWIIPNFSFSGAQLDRYRFVAKNGLDRPVLGKISSFKEPSSIFSITYGKGSKIVDMLNYVLGDAAFERLMQRYFKEFAFKNISLKALQELASAEAGRDLQGFFDAWLNKSLPCDYALKKVEGSQVFLENRGAIQMPLEIEVELDNGQTLSYIWDDKEKERRIEVAGNAKIKSVKLDPKKRILDLDRSNNYWKRKVDIRPVALYSPIYEVPVFLKDDAYTLIVGPQAGSDGLGAKLSFQKPQDNIFFLSHTYNFSEERLKNTVGFEEKHLFGRMLKWGAEGFVYNDSGGHKDQQGFKLYLRRELWPASYGLLDENDHVTLYILRDRDFKSSLTLGGFEDVRNIHYRQQDEAIAGMNLKFGRYGTYPDPLKGWKFNATLENAGHFLGGEDYFWRFSPQLARYFGLSPKQKLAARVKLGAGYPADKGLFQLGGEKGLRGYGYKTINCSQAAMLNAEYRVDLIDNLNLKSWDNLISLEKIQAVGFFDIGKPWFRSFEAGGFKKDAGLGLRFHCNIFSLLERVIFRLDIAQTINEPEKDRRLWFGVGHAF